MSNKKKGASERVNHTALAPRREGDAGRRARAVTGEGEDITAGNVRRSARLAGRGRETGPRLETIHEDPSGRSTRDAGRRDPVRRSDRTAADRRDAPEDANEIRRTMRTLIDAARHRHPRPFSLPEEIGCRVRTGRHELERTQDPRADATKVFSETYWRRPAKPPKLTSHYRKRYWRHIEPAETEAASRVTCTRGRPRPGRKQTTRLVMNTQPKTA